MDRINIKKVAIIKIGDINYIVSKNLFILRDKNQIKKMGLYY